MSLIREASSRDGRDADNIEGDDAGDNSRSAD